MSLVRFWWTTSVTASASPPSHASIAVSAIPGLAELWQETSGDPRICVAVLDGPVDQTHPCFRGAQLSALPTTVPNTVAGGRMSNHGTHVASLIFGQPGSAVPGIAPGCRGIIAPVFSDVDQGPTSQMDLARAINAAVDAGAHVINISGGELSDHGESDPLLQRAVQHCEEEGVLVVAAAGNDSCRCLHVPAALPSVLAVGAVDAQGAPLDSSNWGDAYQAQGVLAPGEKLLGAAPAGGVALRTGTSFATPLVSGVAALLLSLQLKRGIQPNAHAVREIILNSARPCPAGRGFDCHRFLKGEISISGALELLSTPRRTAMSDEMPGRETALNDHAASTGAALAGVAEAASAAEPIGAAEATLEMVDAGSVSPACAAPAAVPEGAAVRRARPPAARFRMGRGSAVASSGVDVVRTRSVAAAECGCGGDKSKQIVFALGTLGFDFGTEARRDGFKAVMPDVYAFKNNLIPFFEFKGGPEALDAIPPNPYDARQIVNYLAGFPRPETGFPTEGGFKTDPEAPPFDPIPEDRVPKGYPGLPATISDASQLIWTLNLDSTPIYAIRPSGDFATIAYQRLVEFLAGQVFPVNDQDMSTVSRVSIPGLLTGETVQLYSGQILPVVNPQVRGMYAWSENALVEAVAAGLGLTAQKKQIGFDKAIARIKDALTSAVKLTPDADKKQALETQASAEIGNLLTSQASVVLDAANQQQEIKDNLRNFLDRVYYELRNLGQTPSDRALNYAATNAFQSLTAFADPVAQNLELDTIEVDRSPICRKDSDCWDIVLRFFDPENVLRARLVERYTVDVSDTFPVLVGEVRIWHEP